MNGFHPMNKERGFSLIELMISLVIGLIILLGLVVVYVSAVRAHNTNNALAQVQENGRFAIHFLSNSIRQAGGTGCTGKNDIAVAITRDGNGQLQWWDDYDNNAIRGIDDGDNDSRDDNSKSPFDTSEIPIGTSPGDRIVGDSAEADAIAVVGAGSDNLVLDASQINGHINPDDAFPVSNSADVEEGSILVACDGSQSAVFQVTGISNGNGESHDIEHSTSGSGEPGNCTEELGYPIEATGNSCSSTNTDFLFSDEMTLSELESAVYYIGNTDHGTGRALFRRQMVIASTGAVEWQNQELVPDVEGMVIRYGYGSDNKVADYADAETINDNDDWGQVRAVRIYLLVASAAANALDKMPDSQQTQTLPEPFDSVDTSDRRLRRVFATTIAIRNRLP